MSTDTVLRTFRDFLSNSWMYVESLLTEQGADRSTREDWFQANWEILVESLLCPGKDEFLEVYADGADCNGASSRVWMPAVLPTHRICCSPKRGTGVHDVLSKRDVPATSLDFDRFVSWDGRVYDERPPFDHVLLQGDAGTLVVPVDAITFVRKPVEE